MHMYFALVISLMTVEMYLNCVQVLVMLCLFMHASACGPRLHHADINRKYQHQNVCQTYWLLSTWIRHWNDKHDLHLRAVIVVISCVKTEYFSCCFCCRKYIVWAAPHYFSFIHALPWRVLANACAHPLGSVYKITKTTHRHRMPPVFLIHILCSFYYFIYL